MKSYGVPLPSEPNTIEYEPSAPYPPLLTLTPSMTYWLSRPLAPETEGLALPTDPPEVTPGAMYNVSLNRRPMGTRSSNWLSSAAPIVVLLVSTTGDAPWTSTVSVTPP